MAVYPKCKHLRFTIITSSLLGIIPPEFIFKDNRILQKCYATYSFLMMVYYVLFLTTAYIQLYLITFYEDFQLDLVSANITVTLINTITIMKQLVTRLTPSFKTMIRQIIENEENFDRLGDKNLNEIYEKGINNATIASKLYLLGLFGVIFQYVTNPLIDGPTQQELGNKTIIVKPLPLSLWSPFDDQKYYIIAYLRHTVDGTIAISFLGYTDILVFTLIAYPVGQLKILNYLLKNFEIYKQKYKNLNNLADDDRAAYFLCVDNIVKHKNIIRYVKYFNETMSGLMLLEFFHFSLEIAAMCIQTVANDFSPAIMLFVADGFLSLIVRLFLYYYYANEVIVLSQELAVSIYKSNWYDQSPKVKFMMQVFMARAQKPLSYAIGPFGDMSLDSMISILKATYTYIMLMYNTK